jgi:hypothetical protein
MTYDGEGKLITLTGPANLNNERYTLTYGYDTTVDVYVEGVTDSFGYVSNATHDFRFGEVKQSTDENGQPITNIYDNFGRLIQAIGPYQPQPAPGTLSPNPTIQITYAPVDPTNAPPVPWAVTTHIDSLLDCALTGGTPATGCSNHIETVLFTDGLKRVLQTKKEASVLPQGGTTPSHVMTVSGRVVFDAFGRTIAQFYPVTDAITNDRTFNPAFDTVRPTKTAYDILDRATSVQVPDGDTPNTGYDTATTTYDFGADRSGQTRFRTTAIDFNG